MEKTIHIPDNQWQRYFMHLSWTLPAGTEEWRKNQAIIRWFAEKRRRELSINKNYENTNANRME